MLGPTFFGRRDASPRLASLHDSGPLDSEVGEHGPFLVLEFLEGMDLERRLADQGPIPWREAVSWLAGACRGVAEAHDEGIIHRDIKPSNIFLASASMHMAPRNCSSPRDVDVRALLADLEAARAIPA